LVNVDRAERLQEWAASYLAAWNRHDPEGIARYCTEDVVWNDPSLPAPAHGRAGARGFAEATFTAFPDFHVEAPEPALISAHGPRALGPYRITGTMLGPWEPSDVAPTGARIEVAGVDEWTFRGELMSRYTTYYDSLDMARQLGVIPPAGSGAERVMARLQHVQARFQRRRASHPRRIGSTRQ
jgi:ketosteroid isomerase-like protein